MEHYTALICVLCCRGLLLGPADREQHGGDHGHHQLDPGLDPAPRQQVAALATLSTRRYEVNSVDNKYFLAAIKLFFHIDIYQLCSYFLIDTDRF